MKIKELWWTFDSGSMYRPAANIAHVLFEDGKKLEVGPNQSGTELVPYGLCFQKGEYYEEYGAIAVAAAKAAS